MKQTKSFLPQPGEKLIGRFQLQELIGVGPLAGVYRARDLALQRDLIVKYLYPALGSGAGRETNLFRLYRARGFLHKNILAVQEVFSGDGYFFVTKDIVDGISLRSLQRLRQENLEPFNKREIVHLLFEICEGLRWIHMLGANGNLKPENILLTDQSLRVDDPFCLAGRTMIPPEHGTFPLADRYLAPEQLEDELQERKESDIYALALILGEILVGRPVKPAVPLSDQGPFFSPELDDVFLKATAKDPTDRPSSVGLFWESVRQVFRVPADEFKGERPPVGFIPSSLTGAAAEFRPLSRQAPPEPVAAPVPPPPPEPVAAPVPPPPPEPVAAPVPPPPPEPVAAPVPPPPPPPAPEPVVEVEIVVEKAPGRPIEIPRAVKPEPVPVSPKAIPPRTVAVPGVEDEIEALMRTADLERGVIERIDEEERGSDEEATLQDMRLSEVMAAEEEEGIIIVDSREAAPPPSSATAGSQKSEELIGEIERIIEETRDVTGQLEEEAGEPPVLAPPVPAVPEPEPTPEAVAEAVAEAEVVAEVVAEAGAEVEFVEDHELAGEPEPEVVVEAIEVEEIQVADMVEVVEEPAPGGVTVKFESDAIAAIIEAQEVSEEIHVLDEGSAELEIIPDDEAEALSGVAELVQEAGPGDALTGEQPAVADFVVTAQMARPEPPPPPPQPTSLPPVGGYRTDAEFWAYKELEEDKDLDEVLVSASLPDREPDEEDGLVVLDDEMMSRPKKGKTKAAQPTPEPAPQPAPAQPAPQETRPYIFPPRPAAAEPPVAPVAQVATIIFPEKEQTGRPNFEKPARKKSPVALIVVLGLIAVAVTVAIVLVIGKDTGKKDVKKVAVQGQAAESGAGADKAEEAGKAEEKKKAAEARKAEEEKKAAEARKAEEEKKAAGARKAEEERKAAEARKAEEEKKAAEARKAEEEKKARTADVRAKLVESLKPTEDRVAAAAPLLAEVDLLLARVTVSKQEFDALDEKARAASADWGKLLAEKVDEGNKVKEASAALTASIRKLVADADVAENVEAFAPLEARLTELAAASEQSAAGALAFVKGWHETTLRHKIEKLSATRKPIAEKATAWKKAEQKEIADSVAGLGRVLDEDLKKWNDLATETSGMTQETAVGILPKLTQVYTDIAARDGEIRDALDRKVEKKEVAADAGSGGTDVTSPGTDNAAEAARKKELSQLGQKVDGSAGDLRKLSGKLKDKAQEWKKAGNETKRKEIEDLAGEIDGLREGLAETQGLIKQARLDEAKVAFGTLSSAVSAARKKGEGLLKEKVASADAAAALEGEKQIKAFLDTLKCPGGMKKMIVKNAAAKEDKKATPFVAYCIDYYEHPGKGSMPQVNVSWDAANGACTAVGKRLCTNSEWKTACGGKYPYGSKYDPEACNTVGDDGLERPVLSAGSKPKCKSGYGLYDMVGNVAEWTSEKTVNGGDSNKTGEDGTCGRSAKRFGGSPFVGFRCCADAK